MGMDVFGKNPRSVTGEYFRRNVWGWHPLWRYCEEHAPVCASVACGHSNDGDGLNDADSITLADILQARIDSGLCADDLFEYRDSLDAMPDEVCDLCGGTGKRSDMVVTNGCNKCLGKGSVRPMDTWYTLDMDDITEFIAFLRDCGGFEIN